MRSTTSDADMHVRHATSACPRGRCSPNNGSWRMSAPGADVSPWRIVTFGVATVTFHTSPDKPIMHCSPSISGSSAGNWWEQAPAGGGQRRRHLSLKHYLYAPNLDDFRNYRAKIDKFPDHQKERERKKQHRDTWGPIYSIIYIFSALFYIFIWTYKRWDISDTVQFFFITNKVRTRQGFIMPLLLER